MRKERETPRFFKKTKKNWSVHMLTIFAMIVSLALVIVPRQIQMGQALFLPADISIGTISTKDVVTRKPLVYENIPATQARQKARSAEAPPVFSYNNTVPFQVRNTLNVIAKAFGSEELFDARLFILEEIFSPSEINYLRANTNKFVLFPLLGEFVDRILEYGILSDKEKIYYVNAPSIIIEEPDFIYDATRERVLDKDYLLMENIPDAVGLMVRGLGVTVGDQEFITFVLERILEPNLFYNAQASASLEHSYLDSVEAVISNVPQGTTVVEKGEVIGEDAHFIMRAIEEQGSQGSSLFQYLGLICYVVLLYFLGFYLWNFAIQSSTYFFQRRKIVLIVLIIWQLLLLGGFVLGAQFFYDFYILLVPTVVCVAAISIFLGSREATLFALFCGAFQVLLPDATLLQGIITIGFGLSGAYFLGFLERRIDVVKVFYKIIFIHLGFTAFFLLFQQEGLRALLIAGGVVAVTNSVWFVLFVFLLPFLEKISNVPTVFRLQELTDMSLPIFQRMRNVAPGTYSHSLVVAEMAEAAAMEIGANKYIAKAGACYHDIGKLDQPEYFIENQQSGANKHDTLKPTLSVSIIKAHIKIGEQKGKELGLPREILDIIAQHHGNGTISYFYFEAMRKEGLNQVDALREEGNFRYNGTPPSTKEGAIVMLADAVEAISRLMKHPSPVKVEKMIWKSITDSIANGQLSESSLSMKELKVISSSFVTTTLGRLHRRIEYPNAQGESE